MEVVHIEEGPLDLVSSMQIAGVTTVSSYYLLPFGDTNEDGIDDVVACDEDISLYNPALENCHPPKVHSMSIFSSMPLC